MALTMTERLKKAIEHGKRKLSLDVLKDKQIAAIAAFLQGDDVFVNLPTGYGKSVIFHIAPFCHGAYHQTNSVAIVVCPLVALMKDQVHALQRRNIDAVYLADCGASLLKEKLEEGRCRIIFASPESLLENTDMRDLIQAPPYRDMICGIFVDEVHCIAKWGLDDSRLNEKAFRVWFGRLSELRSLLPRGVPVIALTATATASVQSTVIEQLNMTGCTKIVISPERSNIRYSVLKVENDIQKNFSWLVNELHVNGVNAERVLIFCRSIKYCRELFLFFRKHLGENGYDRSGGNSVNDDRNRMFAMFHSQTPDVVKESVLHSFTKSDGCVRVVFATIAFGMGIDVKGLYTVIHYGPSSSIDDYFQESGRTGRDGKQSHALLLVYKHSLSKRVTKEMQSYARSEKLKCRRETLLSHFPGKSPPFTNTLHACCDFCAKKCACDQCKCGNSSTTSVAEQKIHDIYQLSRVKEDSCSGKGASLSTDQKSKLRSQLLQLRTTRLSDAKDCDGNVCPLYCGPDFSSGLSVPMINSIVTCATQIDSLCTLQDKFGFHDSEEIWSTLQNVLQLETNTPSIDSDLYETDCESSDSDLSDCNSCSTSDSESEMYIQRKVHLHINSSDSDD